MHLLEKGRHPYGKFTEIEGGARLNLSQTRNLGALPPPEEAMSRFCSYKPSTISRRIKRRMALRRIDRLKDYVRGVAKEPDELRELFQGMFIGITGFFRDPKVFEALKKLVFPQILRRSTDHPSEFGSGLGRRGVFAGDLAGILKDRAMTFPLRFSGPICEEVKKASRQHLGNCSGCREEASALLCQDGQGICGEQGGSRLMRLFPA
jgi:hypothetical protein